MEAQPQFAALRQDSIFAIAKPVKTVKRQQERHSGASRLLDMKQKLFELQEKVDEEKLVYAEKEQKYKERDEKLKERNTALEESLIHFSKYLQENDAKRMRAAKKAADERRLCDEKSHEAEELAASLEGLRLELVEAQEIVSRNMRYQQYLERVLEEKKSLQEISDIITRHATLAATNSDLRQQQQSIAEEMDSVRVETEKFLKAKTEDILAANTAIPRLRKQIEEVKQESATLEGKQRGDAQEATQQFLEHGKVLLAAQLLYQQVLQHSKVAHSSQAPVSVQLRVIANFASDYMSILQEGV